MKIKKLLAFTLALILAVSCLSITAFADTTSYDDDITISVTPEIGDTPATLISKAVLSDSTNLEITEARIFVDGYTPLESITTSGTYTIELLVKLNSDARFAKSGKDYAGEFTLEGMDFNFCVPCYGWDMDEGEFRTQSELYPTLSYLGIEGEITLYDATLDLDDSTTDILDTKTGIEQTYTATVNTPKTDKTKVQVSWILEDIAVTVTNNKIWNTETLTWDNDGDATATAEHVTATFNFKNLSSKRLKGKVTFEAEEDFDPEVEYIDKVVALLSKADDKHCDNTAEITVTLTPDEDDFTSITANTNGTYGTYTVSIAEPEYLTFTSAKTDSSVTPNFRSGSWEYSTDGGTTWTAGTNYTYNEEGEIADTSQVTKITLANVGDKVLLRGFNCVTGYDDNENFLIFSMDGEIEADGDITSITNGVGDDAKLTENCYVGMFGLCEALKTAPKLPSTALAEGCYWALFSGCSSLIVAPELPATELADDCYNSMFKNTGIIVAPTLLANETLDDCYEAMFSGCASLTKAPFLPATVLAKNCYGNMFIDCTSLKVTTVKPNGTEGVDYGVIISGAKTVGDLSAYGMFVKDETPAFAEGTTYYWYIAD